MKTALILLGVATWYAGPYVGGPLYCGGTYAEDTAPWVAVDVSEYQSGRIQCGDLLTVWIGGKMLQAWAMDAGYLYRYYVEQWGKETPIVVDVPRHLWPAGAALSARVQVINTTQAIREIEGRVGP